MKYDETPLLCAQRLDEARALGRALQELRQAQRMRQSDVAARAGMSRATVALIEKGDPGRTLGQVLRYLHAIAPQAPVSALFEGKLAQVVALHEQQRIQRVRKPSPEALRKLDF